MASTIVNEPASTAQTAGGYLPLSADRDRRAAIIFGSIASQMDAVRNLCARIIEDGDEHWDFTEQLVIAARELCSQAGWLADTGARVVGGGPLKDGEGWLLPPIYSQAGMSADQSTEHPQTAARPCEATLRPNAAPVAPPAPVTQAAEAESNEYPAAYDLFVAEVVDRLTDIDAMVAGAAALAEAGERVNYAAILLRELVPEKTEALRNWVDFSGPHYR